MEESPEFTGILPPEAAFCWNEADFRAFVKSEGYVRPKLKVHYYISPECPATIVDLVSPTLSAKNWSCTVDSRRADAPPIFIWEGSRRRIDPKPTLERGGLVNRVAPIFAITTKNGMLEAIRTWCSEGGSCFPPPWYPRAFSLPDELEAWKEHVALHPEKRWIYKPNGGARGIGLILISSVDGVDSPELPFRDRCRPLQRDAAEEHPLAERSFAPKGVIQEYVQDLLLLSGRKFAVRVYLLVARVRPLLVLLHGAAYAKVCGLEYSAAEFSQADLFRHVTNQEFQKMGGQAYEGWRVIPVMSLDELDVGLAAEAAVCGPQDAAPWSAGFWPQVRQICANVVDCTRGRLLEDGKLGTFEILGLDFVCDSQGRAIFLEANRDPSWVIDGDTKRGIIPSLVKEMLDIVFAVHAGGAAEAAWRASLHRETHSMPRFEILVDDAGEAVPDLVG